MDQSAVCVGHAHAGFAAAWSDRCRATYRGQHDAEAIADGERPTNGRQFDKANVPERILRVGGDAHAHAVVARELDLAFVGSGADRPFGVRPAGSTPWMRQQAEQALQHALKGLKSAALAEAMLKLEALPPAERERLGLRGREHIQTNYGLAHIVDRWEELYQELVAGRRIDVLADGRSQREVAETESAGGQR